VEVERPGRAPGFVRYTLPRRHKTLFVVLAYAGLRPQEALALEWRHVCERTLLIERALSDGQLKALKNRRQPHTVDLLAPLRDDLDAWRPCSPRAPAGSGARRAGGTGASAAKDRWPRRSV
jgi:integrase